MTNKKGFTLIELLVVIAIIGILSAIGLVSLNGAREKARDSKAKSDLATVRTGLALFYDDNNSAYPGNVADSVADFGRTSSEVLGAACSATTCTTNSVWDSAKKTLVPTYVADLKSPAAARRYVYRASNFAAQAGGLAGAFVLGYNLEGGGGTYFYSIDSVGTVQDIADANSSVTACTKDSASGTYDGSCPQ